MQLVSRRWHDNAGSNAPPAPAPAAPQVAFSTSGSVNGTASAFSSVVTCMLDSNGCCPELSTPDCQLPAGSTGLVRPPTQPPNQDGFGGRGGRRLLAPAGGGANVAPQGSSLRRLAQVPDSDFSKYFVVGPAGGARGAAASAQRFGWRKVRVGGRAAGGGGT